jgi:hypothetical protein
VQSNAVLQKKRMRARAKKSLELATKYGKVDAGRAARRRLFPVRIRFTVVHSWMAEF